ncbi:MAG: ComEC/Rec2 family competence protein [Alphaproteobacteria bacterium]|nr:ComEC/Rec2 family competence protein [Alphaproteobacteria bacterium]
MNPLSALFENLERDRSRWPFWLPVAVAAGVAGYFGLPEEPSAAILALTPVLGLAAWLIRPVSWRAAIGLLALTFVSLGFSASKIETLLDRRPMLDGPTDFVSISGRVAQTDIMPGSVRLTLIRPRIEGISPEKTPEQIRVKFLETDFLSSPPTGAEIAFKGMLNDMSEPVAPAAADFRRAAYFRHLGGIGWSRSSIEILDPSPKDYTAGERFSLMLERTRKTLARHVYARLKGDVAAVTAARLNGEQTAITPPVMDAMRTAGLAHLLATSGANVTIMGLLIYFPLRALLALVPWIALRFPIKKWAAIAAILSALSFTFLVGSQAATMRSMIMVGLAMAAVVLDRNATPLRLVMLSALIGMLFAPSATMGASFQMSFAAVFCLVASQGLFGLRNRWPNALPAWLGRILSPIAGIALASLLATAATTPFSVYHFQTFNVYGFISNVLAIPLTSFWVMPFTVLAYLSAPWNADGFFIDMAGLGNRATIAIAQTVAAWPHSTFHWPAMPAIALAAVSLGGFWLCLWRERWRYLGLIPVLIGMAYPLYTTVPDILVSPSGRSWAVRLDDGRYAVPSTHRERFILEQWSRLLGGARLVDAPALPDDHANVRCDDWGCVYRAVGLTFALPSKDIAAPEDCAHADVLIAPFAVSACAARRIVDSAALKQFGAHALFLGPDGLRTKTAYPAPGLRPWSRGWKDKTASETAHTAPQHEQKQSRAESKNGP